MSNDKRLAKKASNIIIERNSKITFHIQNCALFRSKSIKKCISLLHRNKQSKRASNLASYNTTKRIYLKSNLRKKNR